jgi:hypothetical protein
MLWATTAHCAEVAEGATSRDVIEPVGFYSCPINSISTPSPLPRRWPASAPPEREAAQAPVLAARRVVAQSRQTAELGVPA